MQTMFNLPSKLSASITFAIFLFSSLCLSGQETPTNLQAIEKRLVALEQENAKLKERIGKLEKSSAEALAQQPSGIIPQDENDKKLMGYKDLYRHGARIVI